MPGYIPIPMIALLLATTVLLPAKDIHRDGALRKFPHDVRYYWGGKGVTAVTPGGEVSAGMKGKHVTVYFDFDSYRLRKEEKDKLKKVPAKARVFLEGYASPEGSSSYNLKLSERRVRSVKSFLEKRGAVVEGSRAYGEEKCSLKKEEWWRCRKVEVKIR